MIFLREKSNDALKRSDEKIRNHISFNSRANQKEYQVKYIGAYKARLMSIRYSIG